MTFAGPPTSATGHRSAELPRPRFDATDAARLLARGYGIHDAEPIELGSQQDRNFRIDHDGRRLVLKVANPDWPRAALAAQDAALVALADRLPGLTVPAPYAPPTTVEIDGRPHVARLLTYVEGRPLSSWEHLAASVVADLGAAAADLVTALAGFSHEGLDRWVQWDVRHAREVVQQLLPRVADPELRERLAAATEAAHERLAALAGDLPVQPIHGDLTDDNLVASVGPDGRARVDGVIDFGDLAYGWRLAELAVGAAGILAHETMSTADVLPAVAAFHDRVPLHEAEIDAFWPMVVARAAVLVVSGLAQLAIDPDNAYAAAGATRERRVFEAATAVPFDVAAALLRDRLGRARPAAVAPAGTLLAAAGIPVLDLSVTSPLLDAGRWLQSDVVAAAVAAAGGSALLRHGEPRLAGAPACSLVEPATVTLGATLVSAEAVPLSAPWDVRVGPGPDGSVLLEGAQHTVVLHGVSAQARDAVPAGAPVATLPAGASLRVQLVTGHGIVPPAATSARLAPGWLAVCLDPSPLLGLAPGALAYRRERSAAELMAARRAVITDAQERYYGDVPPQFERGWREFMVDVDARSYVDTLNNVTMVGHGDPRIAAASARQWLLLNTNSRFHYASIVDYSQRLADLFPDPLDTVFLVNSGSEAVDLALRLAKLYTGRPDIVSVSEAYHGWTEASDAISTSLHDNPRADLTRPAWVHPVLAPNSYRGAYRGPEAADAYAADVRATVAALAAAGRAPAAFICEAVYGKEGAIALPPGYLAAAYAAVREHGGLAIADEVQVGFGRLGDYLWGYQQQGVVPDIVTVAKAAGNGQPLGAVVTRREVADAYAQDGTFFSSAGGSPVSAVVGLTVLDIWQQERLPDNARVVGAHLQQRFADLAARLAARELPAAADARVFIGAIHGFGLYQGVELVHDLETLEPAPHTTLAVCDRLLDLGVIAQPTGENFNILKVKPPLCMTRESADHFVDALAYAFTTGW